MVSLARAVLERKGGPEVAISDRIKAEARRTIDGMTRFYQKYSDEADDTEELEHRIARVEASMEGCNGLTQDEKIQKTAENVFELTCAQERSYDTLRMELRKTRDEYKSEFNEMRKLNSQDFEKLEKELKKGLDGVMKKIEDSGCDSSSAFRPPAATGGAAVKEGGLAILMNVISNHPLLAFNSFMFLLVLVFVSGHFKDILGLFGK